jgi:hypothetical protein
MAYEDYFLDDGTPRPLTDNAIEDTLASLETLERRLEQSSLVDRALSVETYAKVCLRLAISTDVPVATIRNKIARGQMYVSQLLNSSLHRQTSERFLEEASTHMRRPAY